MNPNTWLIHILVIIIFAITACSPQATPFPTVTNVEQVVSILPTVTRKPAATAEVLSEVPTNVPSSINSTTSSAQISSIQLPQWVNDPSIQVFLASTGTFEEGYEGLALFNAETSERFDVPFTEDVGDYFWMPDGSQFGFLPVDQNQITLFSIKNETTTVIPISDDKLSFFQRNYTGSPASPIQVSSSNVLDPNFFLLPPWRPLSPDRKYFIYQEEYDDTYTSIFDISLHQTINISNPNDDYFDLFSEWSPDSQFLAIVEVNEVPLNYYTFETLPDFRLRIYDIDTQQVVASYKNVTFPKWSPDGTKFLFQEWKKLEFFNWYAESPPCIFDTILGETKCYNEMMTYHKKSIDSYLMFSSVEWSPDQTMISYIYSASEQGGFCTITLFSGKINCILERLETDDQNIIEYMWSPDSSYIAFEYDTVGPYSDDTDRPQVAIANIKTGKYFTIGDNINLIYLGLWKPPANS